MAVDKLIDIYTYDQLMVALNSLRAGYVWLEPDAKKHVYDKIRRSAERYGIDIEAYKEFMI